MLGKRGTGRRYREKVTEQITSELRIKPSGLTHAFTSFVGRSAAIEKVGGLLAHHRLVTVTGPGGVGKTRLAAEVLRRVDERFADGVWVVELAAVQDPALVPAAMATVLDLRSAGVPLIDALVARLSRQQVLLVLDNCEHVLDSVVEFCVAALLAADDIRILITSREPLGLPEEARYRLTPLALPDPGDPGQTAQSEAVTLFVERARLVDPDFSLDADSGAAVARLVQGLDGMPLAIELAAARVEALGLAQLVERLDDRFRLLVNTSRVAASRQRSLEAAVDWSYQLLSESERGVFRFLSVFPGPFTLDAAEAVAGTGAAMAVLRLVDCSLLVPPRTGLDGRSRYSMLETLRSFGAGRLRQLGEDERAAAALAAHAIAVSERAASQMAVRDQEQPAASWLDAEDAAVHQGLAWTLDRDPPGGLTLAVALAPWWLVRGRWAEGYALLQRAVDQTDSSAANWYSAHRWLGEFLRGAPDSGLSLGHFSLGHFSTVVDALREQPPSPDLVDGLTGRCAALLNMGRLPEAAEDAHTAVKLAQQIRYAAGAIAWTEAPETLRGLAKQRFRWCFGTMQCLWKHRDMLFNPKFKALGFFSLPSVWFFQIILVALTPMVDLLLLSSVLLGDGLAVLPYFLVFLVLDQIIAILACVLEGEPVSRTWIMIPMRLIYRPLLSWVVWKSIVNAARGVLVGWGKLERTASATVPSRA